MAFHLSLSDSKCLQVPRTLLSIRAYLNNAVASMGLIFPQISNSSSLCRNTFKLLEVHEVQILSQSL